MGVRVLATGHERVSILTTKPANIAAPTTAELNAGIYASPFIPKSLWKWAVGDPTTVTDGDIEKTYDAEVPTTDTFDIGMGVYRSYLAAGGIDAAEDLLFQATKSRGTTLYIYARNTDKLAPVAWATGDEIHLGGSVTTGTPKKISEGYIKYEVPLFAADLRTFITVG